jgi:hypothetical protein
MLSFSGLVVMTCQAIDADRTGEAKASVAVCENFFALAFLAAQF